MSTLTIAFARTDLEIQNCFPVMAELRPHLRAEDFVARVRRQNRDSGFELAYLADAGAIKSLGGIRISECLFNGKYLYIDDLVTSVSARSAGYGAKLFDWLVQYAREQGCDELTLDSGVQRFDAHRFYQARRMNINCHHFALKLN